MWLVTRGLTEKQIDKLSLKTVSGLRYLWSIGVIGWKLDQIIGFKHYAQIHAALGSFGKTLKNELQFEDYDWTEEPKKFRQPTEQELAQNYLRKKRKSKRKW